MEEGGVRGPNAKALLRAGAVGLVVGLAIGLVFGRSPPGPKTHVFRERPAKQPRLTESAAVPEGTLRLVPAGPPRRLLYEYDVDLAVDALGRFLDAFPEDRIERPGPDRARLDIQRYAMPFVELYWRVEGKEYKRTLRIVAVPEDPYFPDDPAVDVIEAIDRWERVNGVEASDRTAEDATCVRETEAVREVPLLNAAVEEFRAKGLDLTQEEVLEGSVCLLARGPEDKILWSVLWEEGGSWAVRHHADPFDTEGEREVLLAIFRRATGREPVILLDEGR